MKKAQGLSMNVIIIAAISLLVLVIISVLVLRAGGQANCWEYEQEICMNEPGFLCLTDMDDFETCYTSKTCMMETKTECGNHIEGWDE